MIAPLKIGRVRNSIPIKKIRVEKSGADLMITGYL
jgi:hypothetical protein